MTRGATTHRRSKLRRWTMVIGGIVVTWSLLCSSSWGGIPYLSSQKAAIAPPAPPHWETITENNFTTLSGEGVIFVFVWQDWCKPCLRFREGALSDSTLGVRVGDYEIRSADVNRKLLDIETLPTMILYSDGEEIRRWQADLNFEFSREAEGVVLDELRTVIDSLGDAK